MEKPGSHQGSCLLVLVPMESGRYLEGMWGRTTLGPQSPRKALHSREKEADRPVSLPCSQPICPGSWPLVPSALLAPSSLPPTFRARELGHHRLHGSCTPLPGPRTPHFQGCRSTLQNEPEFYAIVLIFNCMNNPHLGRGEAVRLLGEAQAGTTL